MKTQLFLPIRLFAICCLSACSDTDTATTTNTDSLSTATVATTPETTTSTTTTHTLSENDTYTDLKTGTTFRVKRDASGNWTRDNGEPLNYYLNPVTRDTFYGPTGRWVNNALNYNPGTGYSIDEVRWNQMNTGSGTTAEMQIDKVKETDEELKMKSADGEDKVKITNDETKIKTRDGLKIKSNEDETKIKQK